MMQSIVRGRSLQSAFRWCASTSVSVPSFGSQRFYSIQAGDPLLSFGKQHIARGVGRLADVVLREGLGSWVVDANGVRYLDFTSGIGVVNTGHCHPRVVEAVCEQAKRLSHGQVNVAFHEPMLSLTKKLLPFLPKSLDTLFYWNSGAEAVEAAVKLARHATGKQNVIVFQGSYHGRTIGTMGMTTSKTVYRAGFGTLGAGIHVCPYPYARQLPTGIEDLTSYCLEQFELMLKQQTAPTDTAAVVIEPVLGEGGYVVPEKKFLGELKALCAKHDILFVADEIQCGFGRTGKMFACEHSNVIPDILIMAKGLASGYPLSAIASRKELMDLQPPGSMGGTYAGNAVACAAAEATLDVFQEEKLLEKCTRAGERMRDRLHAIQNVYGDAIRDVRGVGLMNAIELDERTLGVGAAARVSQYCVENKLLALPCSSFETLRFIPALNISDDELALGMDIITDAVEKVVTEGKPSED